MRADGNVEQPGRCLPIGGDLIPIKLRLLGAKPFGTRRQMGKFRRGIARVPLWDDRKVGLHINVHVHNVAMQCAGTSRYLMCLMYVYA